ncbi:hypothetical protein NHX12_006300 [Muraenolepis orangiensis]|uniref:GOLD domain-containing protein n=1 Tax=Muraenolepis orangiensis TaxID=630683 RepID=A0A9Q0IB43_9TELE|nr:hypothetical protein NHX12_006300 [Muraenolepis orangiensis]
MHYLGFCCLILHAIVVRSTELTFELPDNDKQCFSEELEEGVKLDIDFQVIAGGNYDVDCFVTDPHENILYHEQKKQYDSFSHITTTGGAYQVCFSNEFSTFSHKIVYLDLRTGNERPLLPVMNRAAAMTQLESTCLSIHEILKTVTEAQTRFRLRESIDRLRAEVIHERITYWSLGETALLFAVSAGQVLMLRSFFNDKKGSIGT